MDSGRTARPRVRTCAHLLPLMNRYPIFFSTIEKKKEALEVDADGPGVGGTLAAVNI